VITGLVQLKNKVHAKLVVGLVEPDSKQPMSGFPVRVAEVISVVGAPGVFPALIAGEVTWSV
jgi:hypothetical protein